MEGMIGVVTTRTKENVHTLVYWVKNMRTMGWVPFLKEKDAEVVGHWL